jgi:hypothetical protein
VIKHGTNAVNHTFKHTLRAVGCCLWGVFIRSGTVLGGDAVLVDEAAEPVVPADRGGRRRARSDQNARYHGQIGFRHPTGLWATELGSRGNG